MNATASSDPGSGGEEEVDEECTAEEAFQRDTDSVAHTPKSDETDLPEGTV